MSEPSRRELLEQAIVEYQSSSRRDRRDILLRVVAWTGYSTKYAISLLNHGYPAPSGQRQGRSVKYGSEFRTALISLWEASHYLCSKRLVPFLGDLLDSLERHGHISISDEVRALLLSLSPSTADRILAPERSRRRRSKGTTKPGNLLRKQIAIRTHNGWKDVTPGYFEGDLVAHCGDNIRGSFLYTLVLTDIFTGWTEFEPLYSRTAQSVLEALKVIRGRLPFRLLGLDTDNGSEFINELVAGYCDDEEIEFTRCRPYKKNDQAHVEQKNGSVIRRLVGYDRYDGCEAYEALSGLYRVLRLHLNYFQPSLKLASKERDGAHVTKTYEVAQTPVQRLLAGEMLDSRQKDELRSQFLALDPVGLVCRLRRAQDRFWEMAWQSRPEATALPVAWAGAASAAPSAVVDPSREYRKTRKPKAPAVNEPVDCFAEIEEEIEERLREDRYISISQLFRSLQSRYPGRFEQRHHVVLRRRVKRWLIENPAPPLIPSTAPEHALPLPHTYKSSAVISELRDEVELALAKQPDICIQALFRNLQERYPGRLSDPQIHMFRKRVHEWRREAQGQDQTPRPPAGAGACYIPKQSDSQTQ